MAYSINSSWLSLCNNALIRLNKQQMQSLNEGTISSSACNQALPIAVAHILSQNDWKSARKRIVLAPVANKPAFGYAYQFRLPSDFIRIVEMPGIETWAREGAYILADSSPLQLIYIGYPDNPGELDPLLQEAIICSLASELAMSLIADNSIATIWLQKAELAIQKARLTEMAGEQDVLLEMHNLAEER